ncbi:hypothetical protein [Micrococcus luteus]|nr:hypothetical protein [Micrococcus luteus]
MIASPGDQLTMPRRGSTVRGRVLGRPWERGLPLLVLIVDLVAVLLATFVSAQLRFGASRSITLPGAELIDYGTISLTLSAAWVLALGIQGSVKSRVVV